MKFSLLLAAISFSALARASVVKVDDASPVSTEFTFVDPKFAVSPVDPAGRPLAPSAGGLSISDRPTSTTLPASVAFPNAIPLPKSSAPVPETTAASAVAILGFLLMLRRRAR